MNEVEIKHPRQRTDNTLYDMMHIGDDFTIRVLTATGIRAILNLKDACRTWRHFFKTFTYEKSVFSIDRDSLCENDEARFSDILNFVSGWETHVVRAKAKENTNNNDFMNAWMKTLNKNILHYEFRSFAEDGVNFNTQELDTIEHEKRWKLCILAMCTGLNADEEKEKRNFGEFTFFQWLIIELPELAEFFIRFVNGFNGSMIEFDEKKWPKLKTTFTEKGCNNLTTLHCAALLHQAGTMFFQTLLTKINQEIKARLCVEKPEDSEKKFVQEKLTYFGAIYSEGEEKYLAGEGFNVANLCCVAFSVCLLELMLEDIENVGGQLKYCQDFMGNLCEDIDKNGFHLIAQHGNDFLQSQSDDSEKIQTVRKLWDLLIKYGVDPHHKAAKDDTKNSYFAIEFFLWNGEPHETLCRLFFQVLSGQSRTFQEQVINNFTAVDAPSLAVHVVWKLMTGGSNSQLLWELLKPYAELFLHKPIPVQKKNVFLWTLESTPCEDVHPSDATEEYVAHFLVRFSYAVRVHAFTGEDDKFQNVLACVQELVVAGLDKTLEDSNGKTAAQLAHDLGEIELQQLLTP